MNNKKLLYFSVDKYLIRIVDIDDYNDLFEICKSDITSKFLTFKPYKSVSEAKIVVTNMIRSYLIGDIFNYMIVDKSIDKVIGSISLTFNNTNGAEIGYLLNDKFMNKGIMSLLLPEFIKYTFNNYQLDYIEANVKTPNIASIKLLEKNNFIKEKTNNFKQLNYYKLYK